MTVYNWDAVYRAGVLVEMQGNADGKIGDMGRHISDLQGGFNRLSGMATSVGASLAGTFTGAIEAAGGFLLKLGLIAGGVGLGAVSMSVIKLNAGLESAQIGIAAIFNAQGVSANMGNAMALAASQIDLLRHQAAELPGEFQDLRAFFSLGLNAALNAGMSVDKFRVLAGNAMASAASVGVPMDQAAREFTQLLQGRSGQHNVFGMQLGFTGAKAEQFNAATPDKRLELLTEALAKFNPAIEVFKHSWEGLSSTAIDNLKRFGQMATLPLFNKLKDALEDFNTWFDSHQDKVREWAGKIGEGLGNAFDWTRDKIEEWGPVFLKFADTAWSKFKRVWEEIEPIVERIAGHIKNFLSDPQALNKIAGLLKDYVAIKIGGPAVGAMGSLVGPALFTGGAIGAPVAAAALVGLAIDAVALAGVFSNLSDDTSRFHDYTVTHLGTTFDRLTVISDNLGDSLNNVFGGKEGVLLPIQAAGAALVQSLEFQATAFALLTAQVKDITEAFAWLLQKMGRVPRMNPAEKAERNWELEGGVALRGGHGSVGGAISSAIAQSANKMAPQQGMTVQKVEIVVSSNQDPNRIARAVVSEIQDLPRHPKVSKRDWTKPTASS